MYRQYCQCNHLLHHLNSEHRPDQFYRQLPQQRQQYPPPPQREYRNDRYGEYLFGVSRLSPLKRFDLVLRAQGHWDPLVAKFAS